VRERWIGGDVFEGKFNGKVERLGCTYRRIHMWGVLEGGFKKKI